MHINIISSDLVILNDIFSLTYIIDKDRVMKSRAQL